MYSVYPDPWPVGKAGGAVSRLWSETETLEKSAPTFNYDIDSVRNGLLGFDLMIIAVAGRDQDAY